MTFRTNILRHIRRSCAVCNISTERKKKQMKNENEMMNATCEAPGATEPCGCRCDTEKKMEKCGDMEVCTCKPYNPYEETVPLMLSDNYKDRIVAEYIQTKIRFVKLKAYCDRIEMAETHPTKVEMPPHDCNIDLLRSQLYYMRKYLDILEKRAIVEGICLD